MFYQSLRRHIRSTAFWKWGGWRILKRGAFPHFFTNLWGFLPTCCLLTLPRQWLRNQGIGALRLPFSMVTSVKSLVLLGLRHSSTSADTHSQVDLRRSSRLSVRIIHLFSVSRRGALHWEARKNYFNIDRRDYFGNNIIHGDCLAWRAGFPCFARVRAGFHGVLTSLDKTGYF